MFGLLDQFASSATNLVLVLLASRQLSLSAVGALGIAMLVFVACNGLSKACTSEVLVVRHSASSPIVQRHATGCALSLACAVGTAAGTCCLVSSLFLSEPLAGAMRGISVGLPILLLQDAGRFALIVAQRAKIALASDLGWLLVSSALLIVVPLGPRESGLAVSLWVIGALAGAIIEFAFLGTPFVPIRSIMRFASSNIYLSKRFIVEYMLVSSSTLASSSVVVAFAGLSGAGIFRLAQTVMGPFSTLIQGLSLVATPRLVRLGDPVRVKRRATQLATAMLTISLLWLSLIAAIPSTLGEFIFGRNWTPARLTVVLTVAAHVPIAISFAAASGIRALADAKSSLRARVLIVPAQILAIICGGGLGGVNGIVVGAGVVNLAAVPVWWLSLNRSVARAAPSLAIPLG